MHHQHRPQGGLQVERAAGKAGVEQAAHVHDAEHVVEAALADHEAAVPALADDPGDRVRPGPDVEPDQLAPGRHDRPHRAVREPQHALDHLLLVAVEDAGTRAFGDQHPHLLLGHRLGRLELAAEQAQDEPARRLEQPDCRRAGARDEVDGRRHPRGDALGRAQGEVLGDELADDEREVGDGGDHQRVGDLGAERREAGDARERVIERLGQPGAAEGARDDADQGDADLHRREHAAGIARERQRQARAAAALARQPLQPGRPRRDHGDLGHGEEAVQQHQRQNDEDLEQGHGPLPNASRPARRSEDEHEQAYHHNQADQKDDADDAAEEFQNASHTTLPQVSLRPAPTAALPRGINSAFVLRFPDPAAGTRGPGILMPLAAC